MIRKCEFKRINNDRWLNKVFYELIAYYHDVNPFVNSFTLSIQLMPAKSIFLKHQHTKEGKD